MFVLSKAIDMAERTTTLSIIVFLKAPLNEILWSPESSKGPSGKLESVPFPRARVKLGGRVSSYQVTQPLTYIFEPLTVAEIKA